MFRYTLNRKWQALLTLVLTISYSVLVSFLPLKIGEALDLITTASESESSEIDTKLSTSIKWIIIMVVTLAFLNYARFLTTQLLQEFLMIDMRTDIFKKFLNKDISFF